MLNLTVACMQQFRLQQCLRWIGWAGKTHS